MTGCSTKDKKKKKGLWQIGVASGTEVDCKGKKTTTYSMKGRVKENKAQQANDGSLSSEAIFHF